jgi:hypothetical protein
VKELQTNQNINTMFMKKLKRIQTPGVIFSVQIVVRYFSLPPVESGNNCNVKEAQIHLSFVRA